MILFGYWDRLNFSGQVSWGKNEHSYRVLAHIELLDYGSILLMIMSFILLIQILGVGGINYFWVRGRE